MEGSKAYRLLPTIVKLLIHFVLAFVFSLLVLSFSAGAQQGTASSYRDLLALKLPEQTEVAAKRINDRYYSLVEKRVATLSFKFTDSEMMAWKQVEKTRLLITYHLSDGSSDLSFINPPKPETTSVDELEAAWKLMFTAFWDVFKPYVTRLIDPKRHRIKQAKIVEGQLVVTLLNGKAPAQTLVFDNAWRLRSWSGADAKTNAAYRNTSAYESYDGRYLLKSLHTDDKDLHVTYDLQYQPVNGVMVLKEVNTTIVGTGKNADLPPKLTMYFQDPQVTFEK